MIPVCGGTACLERVEFKTIGWALFLTHQPKNHHGAICFRSICPQSHHAATNQSVLYSRKFADGDTAPLLANPVHVTCPLALEPRIHLLHLWSGQGTSVRAYNMTSSLLPRLGMITKWLENINYQCFFYKSDSHTRNTIFFFWNRGMGKTNTEKH